MPTIDSMYKHKYHHLGTTISEHLGLDPSKIPEDEALERIIEAIDRRKERLDTAYEALGEKALDLLKAEAKLTAVRAVLKDWDESRLDADEISARLHAALDDA